MSSLRTPVPIREVREHAVKIWLRNDPERRGWNAEHCTVVRYLLDDGRLVEQEWMQRRTLPSRHYLIARPARAEKVIAEMSAEIWTEIDPKNHDIIGGSYYV